MAPRHLFLLALAISACTQFSDDPASVGQQLEADGELLWTRLHSPCPLKLRHLLEREGTYVAGAHHRHGTVDIYTSASERDRLVKEFAGRIDRVEEKQFASPRALSDYYEPVELYDFLDQIESDYPGIAQKLLLEDVLFEGQYLYAMKISDNVTEDENEPAYLQECRAHANEVMPGEVCIDAIEYLTSNYGADPAVTRWVDNIEIWFVPMINPDGAHYVHHYSSSWRKNRHTNCGVDLNRNFPWDYRQCAGSSSDCSSSMHHGSGPASEPETQAMIALMADVRSMYYIAYHSSGELITFPGGCGRVDEHALFMQVGQEISSRTETDDGQLEGWNVGVGPEVMYAMPGGSYNHVYGAFGTISFLMEINNSQQPSHATWRDITCQRQRAAWGHLLDRTLDGPKVWGHTYDINTLDPVVATYQFANHPFTSDQEPLQTDAGGRFDRAVMPDSDHLMVFTASGYLPEARAAHVDNGPVEIDVPMTPGQNQNAPIGHAGDDITVNEGELVILDGSQSYDPDGNDVFFLWTRIAGPDILLRDIYTAQPSFYAPSVDLDTSVTFRMVAWDGELESDPDSVTVTILDVWDDGWDGTADDVPLDIPDNDPSGITSVIHVDVDRYVLGVSALVDITHPYVGDLRLLLSSPAGTAVVLRHREGGAADNIHESYGPLEFIGEKSAGDWMLTVIDLGPTDLGRLNYWNLTLDLAGEAACLDASDCDLPHVAVHDCVGSLCAIVTCDTGWGDCNGEAYDGCEHDVSTDPDNCGACGNACDLANADSSCQNGECVVETCLDVYLDCNSESGDGCESDPLSDPGNCGGCGSVCSLPGATSECVAGECALVNCDAGRGNCNEDTQDGCETDLLGDPANCGGCDSVCTLPGATSECSGGVCRLTTCESGRGNCNDDPQDGCETDFSVSPEHCGACDQSCDLSGAVSACVSGECLLESCQAGFSNCNQDDTDGCEADIRTDPDNCGACDNVCELPNAQAVCRDGGCAIDACDGDYADCNQGPADGCEVDTQTDPDNCGSCDNACKDDLACMAGSCDDSCTDVDRDGYPNIACGGSDCNDTEAAINPGANEACNNFDDDCDGRIDEGLECGESSGCGCATHRSHPPGIIVLALFGLLAMLQRRK